MIKALLIFDRTPRDVDAVAELVRFNVDTLPDLFIYEGWFYAKEDSTLLDVERARLSRKCCKAEDNHPELFADNKDRVEFNVPKSVQVNVPNDQIDKLNQQ